MSRREARDFGFKKYNDGSTCKHGHQTYRYTSTGSCVECHRLSNKRLSQTDEEKARKAKWYQENKERVAAYQREYYHSVRKHNSRTGK